MYSALVIDDELLDLEGLKRFVPWERLGIRVEGYFANSITAMDYLETQPVDLVVTDIGMPRMNGLELAERIKEKRPATKIVFISGHEDFHYARKAIQLDADGYVLKPVDDNELGRVLAAVTDKLSEEKRSLEQEISGNMPQMVPDLVRQWLQGTLTAPYITSLLALCQMERVRRFAVALIEIDRGRSAAQPSLAARREEAAAQTAAWLEKTGFKLRCRMDNHRFAVVMDAEDGRYPQRMEELVLSFREASGPCSVTIGLGGEFHAPEQVVSSLQEAETALGYKMFLGRGRVYAKNQARQEFSGYSADLERIFKELFDSAVHYELVRIDDHLAELIRLARQLSDRVTVYNFMLAILSRLEAFLWQRNESLRDVFGYELMDIHLISGFETIEDIESWLRRTLFEVSEHFYTRHQRKNRKLIEEIKRFVSDNIQSKLSRKDVAEHFGFSSSHLGFLFKEETGIAFSDYMIRLRLEKARELLQDPTEKVYLVADRLGYLSLAYFSRQFKEAFGVSPSEFRK